MSMFVEKGSPDFQEIQTLDQMILILLMYQTMIPMRNRIKKKHTQLRLAKPPLRDDDLMMIMIVDYSTQISGTCGNGLDQSPNPQ